MGKTKIGFMLHLYQPPTQPDRIIKMVTRECYDPLFRFIEEEQTGTFSIDIALSLRKRFSKKLLKSIATLQRQKKFETVNTAANHYLLPLMPRKVSERQLALNQNFYSAGVWPPELAVSPLLPSLFAGMGHQWCIADDETFRYKHRLFLPDAHQVPQNWIPVIDQCGILLRSRYWSNMISDMRFSDHAPFRGDVYLTRLLEGQRAWRNAVGNAEDSYLILAVDGETFGHHYQNAFVDFLMPFFKEAKKRAAECSIVSLSDIFFSFKKIVVPREFLPEGSWSTSREDMQNGIPYPLWAHPRNSFHVAWNKFFQRAFAYCGVRSDDSRLQELMDSAFYSCSPWWATKDNPNDRKIAGWCLPLFKRIMELVPPKTERMLIEPYRVMNDFIEQSG